MRRTEIMVAYECVNMSEVRRTEIINRNPPTAPRPDCYRGVTACPDLLYREGVDGGLFLTNILFHKARCKRSTMYPLFGNKGE